MFFKTFCSWRTAFRRLLNIPFNANCFLLPILAGSLPVFDEICKRSSHFINSCLRSRYSSVYSIDLHSIIHGKYYSFVVVVSVGSWKILF